MNYDEPKYIKKTKGIEDKEKPVRESIRELCKSQSFAVLATQGKGQPYTSLIGFATSDDMKYVVFATPKQTRKYSLLEEDNRVSLMVDNRAQQPDSINFISALTITGNGRILNDAEEIEKWSGLLTEKHPYLSSFVRSDSTAVILVEVYRYYYVRRFQEVFEWIPNEEM